MAEYDFLFKLILVGDAGVGKSQVLLRFSDESFTESYISTIGVDFKIKTVSVNGRSIKLQMWDTAGQERFRAITSSYYRGAHGMMIIYDATDQSSFDNVAHWLQEKDRYCNPEAKLMIVGNKTDLLDRKVVDGAALERIAGSVGAQWMEVSAKSGLGVQQAFLAFTTTILQAHQQASARSVLDTEALLMQPHDLLANTEPLLQSAHDINTEDLLLDSIGEREPLYEGPRRTNVGGRRGGRGGLRGRGMGMPHQEEALPAEEEPPAQNASVTVHLMEGKSPTMTAELSMETLHVIPATELAGILKTSNYVITFELPVTGAQGQQIFLQRVVKQFPFLSGPRQKLPFRVSCSFPQYDLAMLHVVPTKETRNLELKMRELRGMCGHHAHMRMELGWNLLWLARNWKTMTVADLAQIEIQARGLTLPKDILDAIKEADIQKTPIYTDKTVPAPVREVERSFKTWGAALEQGVQPGFAGPALQLRLADVIRMINAEIPEEPRLETLVHQLEFIKRPVTELKREGLPPVFRMLMLLVARDIRSVQAIHVRNREGKGPSLRFTGLDVEHALELMDAVWPENEPDEPEVQAQSEPVCEPGFGHPDDLLAFA